MLHVTENLLRNNNTNQNESTDPGPLSFPLGIDRNVYSK